MLLCNLAIENYTIWNIDEACAVAKQVMRSATEPRARMHRVSRAFCNFVLGNAYRRRLAIHANDVEAHATQSKDYLLAAVEELERLTVDYGSCGYGGVANTCRGALIESELALGAIDFREAIARLEDGLSCIDSPASATQGDLLESFGWWCVFGCNVVSRADLQPAEAQRYLAVFTTKAHELAERSENWAMWERLVSIEFARRSHVEKLTGVTLDWTLDRDDLRVIAGTMGRFPRMLERYWPVLDNARVVD
ncbi:MAG: hypothetical protein ACYTGP_11705 [Planctomycetota bacterium]|jgi:hypothetical protein